jgi:WD40 repeat protein
LDTIDGHEVRVLHGHSQAVRFVAVSPHGEWIVSAGKDQTIRIWDSATGVEREDLRILGHATCAAVSNDGRWLVSGISYQDTSIWDMSRPRSKWYAGPRSHSVSLHLPVLAPVSL